MKTKITATLFALLIMVSVFSCNSFSSNHAPMREKTCVVGEYLLYEPMFMNRKAKSNLDIYVVDKSKIKKNHYENVLFVLDYYETPYKLENGDIFLECSRWLNVDYVFNLTYTAENQQWINTKRKGKKERDEKRRKNKEWKRKKAKEEKAKKEKCEK